MADFLDKISNNKKQSKDINKQLNKTTTPSDKSEKKTKSVKVTSSIYRQLKILSAIKDDQISDIVDYLIKYGLKNSPKYHNPKL